MAIPSQLITWHVVHKLAFQLVVVVVVDLCRRFSTQTRRRWNARRLSGFWNGFGTGVNICRGCTHVITLLGRVTKLFEAFWIIRFDIKSFAGFTWCRPCPACAWGCCCCQVLACVANWQIRGHVVFEKSFVGRQRCWAHEAIIVSFIFWRIFISFRNAICSFESGIVPRKTLGWWKWRILGENKRTTSKNYQKVIFIYYFSTILNMFYCGTYFHKPIYRNWLLDGTCSSIFVCVCKLW